MSWYKDPQLFIFGYTSGFYLIRVTKGFNVPIVGTDRSNGDVGGTLRFSEHLSLGFNKETDYDAFKATFPRSGNLFKHTNSQGWVINFDIAKQTGTWSQEAPNSPFWSLPGITRQKSVTEQQALEDKVSGLEEKISYLEEENKRINKEKEATDAENSILKAQVNRDKDEKGEDAGLEALQQQVTDLASKLAQCCGTGSAVKEPWISGQTVPSTWVPFGDLDVLTFSKNTPFTITKATGGLKFGEDNTTNVQANRFYGGIFPIVVVDVAELTPNREDARFDPCIWGLYNNAGISYAARKPFASEMSFDAHTRPVNVSSIQPADEASVRENLQGHFHA